MTDITAEKPASQNAAAKDRSMTGAQIIVQGLADQGVDVIFGYPGGAVLPIYDALFQDEEKHGARIKHVLVRHEQGAAHAAEGYARSSGKVGVCLVTSGPGATNAITGIVDALMDSIPMVIITGQVPTHLIGTDAFQEADTVGITRACTKHNYLVKNAADLPKVIHEAFKIAATGRPGPVLIDVPKDVQFATADYYGPTEVVASHAYNPRTKGDSEKIRAAVEMIATAKKPLFYTGGGIINAGPKASQLLRDLAKETGVPVTSTLMGLGAFPASDPAWLGMVGMHGAYESNHAMHDCDVMVCIGARFDDRVTGLLSKFAPNSRKIHIDIDPSSINKNVRVEVGILGDCGSVLEDMLAEWKRAGHRKADLSAWWAQIDQWRARNGFGYRNSTSVIKPQYALQRLQALTEGRDTYITTEVGQHQMWAAQFLKFEEPNRWMTSGGLGTMGYGLPAAVGVQMAHPGSLVIDVAGEASVQMTMQEMSTAVQFKLPIKIFILNNEWMGMVRQWQQLLHGERYSHSYSDSLPDFVMLAQAYGGHGIRCSDPAELDAKIMEMIDTPKPVIFDCLVEKAENCFPMIPSGKAHNEMLLGDSGQDISSVIDAAGRKLV
ncbi:MAG: acetolactate synthase, large subunit, biosynthetic type [Caulobacteraceae bacterium]|nr:acetolactate synthase, large subunit, biosynthetic type [Caulobacteraceae bacterium]